MKKLLLLLSGIFGFLSVSLLLITLFIDLKKQIKKISGLPLFKCNKTSDCE